MENKRILDLIEQETQSLLTEQLRSKAAIVRRLLPLISQAMQLGHAHKVIHQRLLKAGLNTSQPNYEIYLYRAKKKQKLLSNMDARIEKISYNQEAKEDSSALNAGSEFSSNTAETSAMFVHDALVRAQDASKKDYSQIAKNRLRNKT